MDKEKAKIIQEMRAAIAGRNLVPSSDAAAGAWLDTVMVGNGTVPGFRNRTNNGTVCFVLLYVNFFLFS